jgi:hypothetical protein
MTAPTIARVALVALLAACGGDSNGPDNTDGGGNGPPPEQDVATVVVVDGDSSLRPQLPSTWVRRSGSCQTFIMSLVVSTPAAFSLATRF